MQLTTQELIILLVLIIAVGTLLGAIFRSALRLIISICLVIGMYFVCFTWLPEQVEQWRDGTKTPQDSVTEVVEDIKSSGVIDQAMSKIEEGNDYIEQNKDSWIDSFQSLLEKLTTIPKPAKDITA